MDRVARRWRMKFRNGFSYLGPPPEDEMPAYDLIFSEMEEAELNSQILERFGLHEILDSISELPVIPRDEEYHFRQRAVALLEKWRALPNSPVYTAEKKAELAARAQARELENKIHQQKHVERRTAKLAALNTPTVIMPCRSSTPPALAHEILTTIYECASEHTRPGSEWRVKPQEDLAWVSEITLLVRCCLVSKDWYVAARRVLYSGRIILYDSKTVELLFRTVLEQNVVRGLVQYLYFQTFGPIESETSKAAQLLSCCVDLRHVEGKFSFKRLSDPLPIFENLQVLAVSDQVFMDLAPLLHRLPNLRILDAICFTAPERYGVRRADAPRERGTIPDIPPPTFQLDSLYISQCTDLSYSQWKWLLSTSTSIKHAQVQEIRYGAEALAEVIGTSVQSLHLKGMVDAPQVGDEDMVRALPAFVNLTSLQVSGEHWFWDQLYENIRSSLESFTISYSIPSTDKLAMMLNDMEWQPTLKSVTVNHWADTDVFYGVRAMDVRNARDKLEAACTGRSIPLRWIVHGNSNSGIGGITQNDLAL
ncbi:hypothetical protein B0H10DRAFT_2427214 [Mycena sp. CBHHK59/15]|nr:hypothetical protein B0H10DRAFT_2427214 [Mycena sp. CBHHK59/15]